MANDYYTPPIQPRDGDVAYVKDVNDISDETDLAFSKVQVDITTLEEAIGYAEERARKWAENPVDVEVEPGQYSALHWATYSQYSYDAISLIYNEAIVVIATAKDEALVDISDAKSEALVDINATKDVAVGEVESVKDTSLAEIEVAKDEAIESVLSVEVRAEQYAQASETSALESASSALESANSAVASYRSSVEAKASEDASAISATEAAASAFSAKMWKYLKVDASNDGYTPSNHDWIMADTSTGVRNVSLPDNPEESYTVGFSDYSKTFGDNILQINSNSSNIEVDLLEGLDVGLMGVSFILIFKNGLWRIS